MKTIVKAFLSSIFLFLVLISLQAQMPDAIRITPEGASGFDEITLTFFPDSACVSTWNEGLAGLDSIAMHSSAILVNEDPASWNHIVMYDAIGYDGKVPHLYADSDTSFSITFTPSDFYGTGAAPIISISAVFNDCFGWTKEGKDHGIDGCKDFYIPLGVESASVTFNVNMAHQIFLGNFDPIFDFIDVAGNFNNWGNPGATMKDSAQGVIDSIYSVTVNDLFVGQQIEYKFRKNKDWGTSELPGYDKNRKYIVKSGENEVTHWYDDAQPILKTLTLNVNMNYLLEVNGFNPLEDSVDVAGTFNEWGFGDTIFWMTDPDADGIYTIVIDSLFVGQPIEYKFRLDATWGRNELPGTLPNRSYVIRQDTNLLTHWWNDDDPTKTPGLFIAEYIDGAGDNNALVIGNRSNNTIWLHDFGLIYTTDGSDWSTPLPLKDTLANNDSYLIVNEGFDFSKIDSARVVDSVWSEVTSFNGNDAIALVRIYAGGTRYRIVDQIGMPLEDPGAGWDVAGIADATMGKRLKRKSSILRGNPDWTRSSGTNTFNSEWIVLNPDIPEELGHYKKPYTLDNQWHTQTSGVDKELKDITFDNSGHGIAVGWDGTILFSNSNGMSWESMGSVTANHLYSIHFPDKNHGWIVGSGGTILQTTDGGRKWSSQSFGAGNWLESVFFLDSLNGYATGEYILLRTSNGGKSWNWLYSENLDWFNSIYFVNDQKGFAVGYNLVIMTKDGGQSWERIPFSPDKHFHNVFFFDYKTGWLLGWEGVLMHTDNGGITWTEQVIQSEGSIRDLYFITPEIGWAVGDQGKIFKTVDGGTNWVEQNSGTEETLNEVFFVSRNKGWIVGENGTILSTLDGWRNQPSASASNNYSIFFVDESTGWIAGDEGTILKTTNAGEIWDTMPKIHLTPTEPHYDIFFSDEDHGWIASSGGYIYKTENGGTSWDAIYTGTGDWYQSVFFLDNNTGWATAGGSKIARTINGGDSWDLVTVGSNKLYSDVFFINSTIGWVVGQEGIVLKTTNGGVGWVPQFTPTSAQLESVHFLDVNTGIVAGSDGTILRTINGGTDWVLIPSEADGMYLKSIFFLDQLTGWIVGQDGLVIHTIDGGLTWHQLPQANTPWLNEVYFVDRDNGWAVGDNGTIVKTSSGGCEDAYVDLPRQRRICDGEETILDAGNSFGYIWNTGSEDPTVTVTMEGYYSVIARNLCMDEARDSTYLNVTDLPNFEIKTDRSPILCKGEKVGVSVELLNDDQVSDYLYTWDRVDKDTSVVEIDTSGFFRTTVYDRFGCHTMDSIEIEVQYPWDEKIGVVTFDPVERRNLVVWEKTANRGTEYYNIYKVLALQKKLLGSVDYGELSVFVDTSSRPRQQSDRYVITTVDTCGNESFYSASHKTMHLTANKGAADEINLIWEHYEGLPVQYYYVFRGSDSTAMALLDSIAYDPTKTQYTDENAPTNYKVYYQIGIKLPEVILLSGGKKAGSGPYSHALSNLEDNRLKSTINVRDLAAGMVRIYPNPFTDVTTIQFENPANKPYRFTIRDISGKLVRSPQFITGSEIELLRGDLKGGYYFVELRGENIYRGKVVIE